MKVELVKMSHTAPRQKGGKKSKVGKTKGGAGGGNFSDLPAAKEGSHGPAAAAAEAGDNDDGRSSAAAQKHGSKHAKHAHGHRDDDHGSAAPPPHLFIVEDRVRSPSLISHRPPKYPSRNFDLQLSDAVR